MANPKVRKRTFYTKEFRDRALLSYHSSYETAAQTAHRFGVNLETFQSWVKRYSNKNINFEQPNKPAVKEQKKTRPDLEKRIEQLEKELEYERMRSICLDKMIEIAEEELHVQIRKKSGAKQSKR